MGVLTFLNRVFEDEGRAPIYELVVLRDSIIERGPCYKFRRIPEDS